MFEKFSRLLLASHEIEAVNQPEGARKKRAFAGWQSIDRRRFLWMIAIDKSVADEIALNRLHRADDPRIRRGKKPDEWQHQHGRIERVRTIELREGLALRMPSFRAHVVVNRMPRLSPTLEV